MGVRSFIESLYKEGCAILSGDTTIHTHERTPQEEQEYEDELKSARDGWERENSHIPADEQYYSCSSEVIVKTIETHRSALNSILSHEELLDPYVADLETKIPYYRTRKQLYNWLIKFPGARATMDKVRQEVEEQITKQSSQVDK